MATTPRSATCLVRRGGAAEELAVDLFDDIDKLLGEDGTVVWLQLRDPTPEDLDLLREEFDIHPLAMEDVSKRGQRPKLDTYPGQHMLVMYEAREGAGTDDAGSAPLDVSELHAFGGSGWLVSVQWGSSRAVDVASTHFRAESPASTVTVGSVLYTLLDATADSYFPVLDAIAERIEAIEDRILAGDGGTEGLAEIILIKRQLLELRRVVAPMREVANALLRREVPLIDETAVPYFQDLYDHLVRILDQIDLYRDLLATVLDARLTVASNGLNAVMKRLTAITVILMAPTLVAGIYGMNFDFMPELGWAFGYPYALGLMAAVMVGALLYFRSRDWF